MKSEKIVTAYRFDESIPIIGSTIHCFKSFEDLQHFAKLQGNQFVAVRFWEITGTVVRDEGGPDGWVITIKGYKQVYLELY